MKLVAEQCSVISISNLQKTIRKIINRDDPTASEEEVFRYTEQELLKFKINDQTFQYNFMKNQLGGYRWFFFCGKCNSRVQKLFLPPEAYTNYEHKYLCKDCHDLLNESVMKANNNLYKRVIRPLRKLRKIEEQLEKGHIQEKKIEELLNEYDAIEKEMKSFPEYRLYAFRKKRGIKIE
jgi:uncharacterized protein YlaI